MGKPEAKNEGYLVTEATRRGMYVRKVVWQNRRRAPDRLLGCKQTKRQAFVECKADGEEPTEAQWLEINEMRECGFTVFVVNSRVTADGVLAWLSGVAARVVA